MPPPRKIAIKSNVGVLVGSDQFVVDRSGIPFPFVATPDDIAGASGVTGEAAARVAGDASNATAITAEIAARTVADTAEATARTAADTVEHAARSNADNTERTQRINADNAERDARIAGDLAAIAGARIYAPLCAGGTPPVLLGTVDGQAIMVPIT